MTVQRNVSKRDAELIRKIAQRAAAELGLSIQQTQADLTVCHANGNPLRLAELLEARRFDFAHDIFGVKQHLDRRTGKLRDFFSPRYSQPWKGE